MELELQGWKVKLALGALVARPRGGTVRTSCLHEPGRAEDWHRRAIVAEESVTGLRVVIVERSRALNRRTVQANQLVSELHSTRAALRRSKVNVGTLTRRQRELANENARIEKERRKLQTRQAALETIASKLSGCAKTSTGRTGKRPRTIAASAPSTLASCRRFGRESRRVSGAAPLIVGPGWAFLGLLAMGLVAFSLIPGCGIVVVDEAPSGQVRLDAPPLVEVDPGRRSPRGALRDPVPRPREAPGAARRAADPQHRVRRNPDRVGLRARLEDPDRATRRPSGRRRAQGRSSERPSEGARRGAVYRLGEFGIARVERRLPRTLPLGWSIALGAPVAVVGYPLSAKPRLLPGVVVDSVAGAPFGVHGRVMRLTSTLRHDEPGGPVIDAKGRIVAVAFATTPGRGSRSPSRSARSDRWSPPVPWRRCPSCGT